MKYICDQTDCNATCFHKKEHQHDCACNFKCRSSKKCIPIQSERNKTLQAIRETFSMWVRYLIDPGNFDMRLHVCPLCVAVGICTSCPIYKQTGKTGCNDTPFIKVRDIEGGIEVSNLEAAIREEVIFLMDLYVWYKRKKDE